MNAPRHSYPERPRDYSPTSEDAFDELLRQGSRTQEYHRIAVDFDHVETKAEEEERRLDDGHEMQPFAEAILRWQLHKGRRTSPLNSSVLAGVDENGNFVNSLCAQSSEQHWQKRMLARCFLRLKRHHAASLQRSTATSRATASRKRRWFELWVKVFYATRFFRLQLLSKAFAEWTDFKDIRLEKKFIYTHVSNFRRYRALRRAWSRLGRNATNSRQYRAKVVSAERQRELKLKAMGMTMLRSHVNDCAARTSALAAADTKFRCSVGKRMFVLLKLNVCEKQNNRYASLKLERSKLKRSLRTWNSWKDSRVLSRLQSRGAKTYFKYRKTRKCFHRWKTAVNEVRTTQCMIIIAGESSKRRVLRKLVTLIEQRRNHRAKQASILLARRRILLRQTLLRLVECKVRGDLRHFAISRGRKKRQKVFLQRWYNNVRSQRAMQSALWFHRENSLFQAIARLKRNVMLASQKSRLQERRRAFIHTRLLYSFFHAWATTVSRHENNRVRAALATLFRVQLLESKTFLAWRNVANYRNNLADAYVMVRLHKLLGDTFHAWYAFCKRGKAARKVLRKRKRHRLFNIWRETARSLRIERQATCVAALYRRSNTLELYFGQWFQYLQTRRSKAKVNSLARLIARRRFLERSTALWRQYVVHSKQHKATRFHELYITIKMFRRWKKLSLKANRKREHWRIALGLQSKKQLRSTKPELVKDKDIASYFFLLRKSFEAFSCGAQESKDEKLGLEMWRYLQYRKALFGWKRVIQSSADD